MCRGDHEVNEIKLRRALGAQHARLLSDDEMKKHKIVSGYIGPINLGADLRIVADLRLKDSALMVVGANEEDHHFGKVQVGRDFTPEYFDLKTAGQGDRCGRCGSPFVLQRGIEVGHVFYLGTKYSKAMGAAFLGEDGKEALMEMGCYGIGVGRTAAAAIEQNNDESGIIWPIAIAPFQVALVRIASDEESTRAADQIYADLSSAGIEVLYDDRDERPGVKFKDNDLIGCPLRLTVGGRSLKEGMVELKMRRGTEIEKLSLDRAVPEVVARVSQLMSR
jgi:prolyl-tRNA synthetase